MMVKKRNTGEHPFLNLEVEGKKELCLLDTGSGITIFNPSKGCTDETDEGFKTFKVLGECSARIHSYAGEMMARKRVGVGVGWGKGRTTRTVVVLAGHTEGFPRVLLGRRTLLVHMGGMKMRWDTEEKAVQVEFGRWPGEVGKCTDQMGDAVEEHQVCVTEAERLHMVVEEDQKRKVTTEAVAGWILRKEEGPLGGDEKPRDDPQSEAFVEEEERHTSVMVNPEDECGTGDDWIEDCDARGGGCGRHGRS
jgi:hypothetical protein